ncbi:glycosyltransferase family 4 protein [Synechocystis sp. PCC 7509]|uniref:glycosyltransferase family 4 protein n=1 Tax=Synechocystis sp. PCC 7509 TaxID=927677 RepID=UPI0002ACC89A|nr:glycosyltransferase family 4 protein [Synechocystis sp. PCC 7509]
MSKCIVITHQHSLSSPGGGTLSCLQIAQHLQKLGVDVFLVPVSNDPTVELKASSAQVMPVPPSRIHYLFNGINVAKSVQRLIANKNIDAVLSWDYEAAFLPKLLQAKNIVFGTIASSPSYETWVKRKTKLPLVKAVTDAWFRWRPLKSADVVFVSSNFTRNELITLFQVAPERIKTIHRGIDTVFGKVQRIYRGEVSQLIFYGSLAPLKGVFDVIEALGTVAAQSQHSWTLKIAGWGNEELVKKAARDRGIEDKVILLGRLDSIALARELESADLAILPSHAESFGRAIAEAQAAGLPVISYDVGSVPEIVEKDVTGWLVPLDRVDLLAGAAIAAMEDPQKTFAMGLAGRERVARLFSWEQTALAILKGIEEAKGNRYE